MRLLLLAFALLQAESPVARNRTVEIRDGDTVQVRARVSSANQNLLTAVTFPDLVQTVVSSWSDRDLSLDYQGAKLFIKLLAKAEGHLDVVTAGGTHVRLFIRSDAASDEYDGHLVLKATTETAPAAARLPEALELVRAMRLGELPAGVSVRKGGNTPVALSADVEARLAFVYETTNYRGYVVRLVNKSSRAAYQLDVARFASPRLVLAGAKSLVIPPDRSTLLYLVLWK